jgi:AGZA family xanthine/uracil permease-like MFS transporter
MMSNVKNIDFSKVKNSVPAFLTIAMMVLSYSITNGIGIGVVSYFFINIVIYIIDVIKFLKSDYREKPRLEISFVTLIVTVLFLIYFLFPTI